MRLAYLYSRYPVLSQTFCDTEMIELESQGFSLLIGSIHPPLTSMRHAHAGQLAAPIHYAPPPVILRIWEEKTKLSDRWPAALVESHNRKYGGRAKAELRARNACYFADLFTREGAEHFHVHFANRAAHTALFLKQISGLPFSITAHGQDFMADLGNDDLLREICAAAEFVAVETDYSRDLLAKRCPESAEKIHRVYNGMELTNFPDPTMPDAKDEVRILSIGRLVPFKGFQHLISACAKLRARGLRFTCEIVGDGALRESLQTKICGRNLSDAVTLTGALPQEEVMAKLRACDIFALAATTDELGASDIFPTVILEAMASGKPVVSTHLAGIPESVAHGKTGVLVPATDEASLADALAELIQNHELRRSYGSAGRGRVEEQFQIRTTVAPLARLYKSLPHPAPAQVGRPAKLVPSWIAYLIDVWPDDTLPLLEEELSELERRNLPIVPFVFRVAAAPSFNPAQKRVATRLEFLPDALVIEAQWQSNSPLIAQFETDRANQEQRAPSAIFLSQARYAIATRKVFRERRISHVHATSSRTLLSALMLNRLTGATVSIALERAPELAPAFIRQALKQCAGGRLPDKKMMEELSSSFLFDSTASGNFASGAARRTQAITGFDLTGRARLWQEWSQQLRHWNREDTCEQRNE